MAYVLQIWSRHKQSNHSSRNSRPSSLSLLDSNQVLNLLELSHILLKHTNPVTDLITRSLSSLITFISDLIIISRDPCDPDPQSDRYYRQSVSIHTCLAALTLLSDARQTAHVHDHVIEALIHKIIPRLLTYPSLPELLWPALLELIKDMLKSASMRLRMTECLHRLGVQQTLPINTRLKLFPISNTFGEFLM